MIFFQNGWDPDYVEAGGPGSPNWHKSNALRPCAAGPSCRASCWPRAAGTTSWSTRCRRSRATSSSRKPRYSGLLQHQARQPAARARHPQPGLRRHRHQRLRRVDPARRLLPGIFRRHAGGRHAPGRARLHPGGRALQRREVLRLGLDRRRFLRRLRPANIDPMRPKERPDAQDSHLPARHRQADRALLARHPGRRRGLCLGHAGARQGHQRRPCRRRRQARPTSCWRPSSR